jgi:hypothetical protein
LLAGLMMLDLLSGKVATTRCDTGIGTGMAVGLLARQSDIAVNRKYSADMLARVSRRHSAGVSAIMHAQKASRKLYGAFDVVTKSRWVRIQIFRQ